MEYKPLERADAYVTSREGGMTWDIEGMAADLMILIKVAKISRAEVHRKMDELYDEVEAEVVDLRTVGNA
jgi:hypothetical protein